MKVVDASVVIEVLIGSDVGRRSVSLLDDDIYAPDLLMPEVLSFFRKAVRRGEVGLADAMRCVDTFARSDLEYCAVWPYAARVWELRENFTTHDACYVALAEDLGCPLLTADVRLAGAPQLTVPVIVV